jgi:signal transduction histidine kinase
MSFRDLPVRRKLMTIILVVTGAVSLFTFAILLAYDNYTSRTNTRINLNGLGAIIAENSTAALAFYNQDDATEILAALRAEKHVVAAGLYDASGRLFAKYPADRPEADYPARPGADGYTFTPSRLKGFQPVTLDGNRIGTLYLEQDRAVLRQRLVVYAGLLGLLAVLSFGLAYGLTALMQRGISGPLQGLTATAQAAALGDYTLRAERLGSDELGVLTDAFNHMLGEIQKLNVELEARVHRRTAQLESANQELEAFSYSVSHDLRAPLRHIDGFAQLLQKHLGAGLDETGRRYLQTIADSAKRLGILIDELLVFSRMARTELRQLEVPMGPLVEEAIRSLQPDVQGRNVAWAVGDLPVVRADAAMLRQVWVNLLSNAVKYTRRQAAARIEIAHRLDPGDGHVFSVRDNGAGFDMQYVDKLFGVFQRLHPAAEFEGTGIGLANVQRIIQRHHGRVWAEGRVNGGATFHFTLPRGPELV